MNKRHSNMYKMIYFHGQMYFNANVYLFHENEKRCACEKIYCMSFIHFIQILKGVFKSNQGICSLAVLKNACKYINCDRWWMFIK